MGKPWAAYHFETLAQTWTLNFSQQFRVFTFNFHVIFITFLSYSSWKTETSHGKEAYLYFS